MESIAVIDTLEGITCQPCSQPNVDAATYRAGDAVMAAPTQAGKQVNKAGEWLLFPAHNVVRIKVAGLIAPPTDTPASQ